MLSILLGIWCIISAATFGASVFDARNVFVNVEDGRALRWTRCAALATLAATMWPMIVGGLAYTYVWSRLPRLLNMREAD